MLTKLLDKITEKIIEKVHKFRTGSKSKKESIKINTELLQRSLLKIKIPTPPPQSTPKKYTAGFPKETEPKETSQQDFSKRFSKEIPKTIISIEESEMEKVVKIIIDIGPNMASVMKDLVQEASAGYGGEAVNEAFGPFLQESAKNIVLVLKENSENKEQKGEESK